VAIGHESLDFGDMLVGRSQTKNFQLANKGEYPVRYRVHFTRPHLRSMFVVSPMEGTLSAGEETSIGVRFTAPGDHRTHLHNNKHMVVSFFDQRPGEAERLVDTHEIVVSVQTHYAELRLQPLAGINFGAVTFCETRTRNV
jgi:hypothetical protein